MSVVLLIVFNEINPGHSRQADARNGNSVRVRRLSPEVQDPDLPHQTQEQSPPTARTRSMCNVQKDVSIEGKPEKTRQSHACRSR